MVRALLMVALCTALLSDAHARRGLPTAANNRAHAGVAWTPGSVTTMAGFDSRMTVNMSMDVGGFISFTEPTLPLQKEGTLGFDNPWVLRHGLFVLPGLRVPHRNRADLKWDAIIKGGFGPVWLADSASRYELRINPALVSGIDLMLRYGVWGIRMENRVWYMKPFSKYEKVEVLTVRPQVGLALQREF